MLKRFFLILTLVAVMPLKASFGMSNFQKLSPEQIEENARLYTKYGISGVLKGLAEGTKSIDGTSIKNLFDKGLLNGIGQGLSGPGLKTFRVGLNSFGSVIRDEYIKFAGIFLGCTAASVTLSYGIPLLLKRLDIVLSRPKLIIESSQKTFKEKLFGKIINKKDMIFSPNLENKLNEIVQVTSTIHKKIKEGNTNVAYRNLMLYGPPGTGKTLFATELAKRCGLEYAFMSGSSFSKFKDGEGIEALDELFAWANASKGLLIFIDEAETFLQNRENMDPQSKGYLLLNNFLNYTGTRSNKFMIVFATNHKNNLDSAMYRRIDDLIEITLPGKAERIRVLNLYKNLVLMDVKQNGSSFVSSVVDVLTPTKIDQIAEQTKGLSAAEIEGIINSIKTSTDILEPAVITDQLVDRVVTETVAKHFNFSGGSYLGMVEN